MQAFLAAMEGDDKSGCVTLLILLLARVDTCLEPAHETHMLGDTLTTR